VTLTKVPDFIPKARRAPVLRDGDVACDEILLGELKKLRKRLADEREVPAYVIFGDKTLRQMARQYPAREADMHGIFGMGEKKREEFGGVFARFIEQFLETNPRQRFDD
jgi:ATP-dependent DNA helicase RecQ